MPAITKAPVPEAKPIPYVCMPGSPFTGSTLLGMLLNEHPACASIGAATGLIRKVDLTTYACSCGKLYRDCGFWRHIATRTAELGYPVDIFQTNFWNTHLRVSHNRFLNALLVRSLGSDALNDARDVLVRALPGVRRAASDAGWRSWSLAATVLERTGKRIFVDTARDHQRPKYLARHPLLDVRVIHLVRDARGNSASLMKHAGLDAVTAARQWTRFNLEAMRVRRYFPDHAWMTLRYEELCADPAGTLDRIARFLGVEPVRLRPDPHDPDRHVIGNPMRLRALSEIREDLSWHARLTRQDLDAIGRIAGAASRRLGFTWPDEELAAAHHPRTSPQVPV